MPEAVRPGADESMSRMVLGVGIAGLIVPLVGIVALLMALRQGERMTEDQNLSLGAFLGGAGTFLWLLALVFFMLGGCAGDPEGNRSKSAGTMAPRTGERRGSGGSGVDGESRGMFGTTADLTDAERDRLHHLNVDTRGPGGAEPTVAQLFIFPVRESWPARTTPPAADSFDTEDWQHEVVTTGNVAKVVLKGVVINRASRDCRTMSLKAYCVDGYGQFLGEGGTVVRDVGSRDPAGIDFVITIGGIPVDANGEHAVDHVVLTRGKVLWATE